MPKHLTDLARDLETLLEQGEISATEYAEAAEFICDLQRDAEELGQ
jgi:hypothetical protein